MRHACPNVITLNHYVSGALDESKAEEIAEHLAVCDRCQQRSDEMASETDGLIGAVRRGAVAASKNDEPQLARLITEALNVGSSPNSNFVEGDSPDDSQLRSKPKRKDLETFIDGLRKSGLIDEKELHRLVVTSAAEDPDSFAKELVEQDALTAYQARALSRGRWKGLVLGNYVIVEKLGKGGMGQVYKARHDLMGRTVCLKVLRSVGRRSPEVVERFRREIKTHSALSHPNFVVAHDADEAEGIQFLVMEFIDGRDLSRRVKDEGPPLVKEAVKIMRQTAAALEYAHDQGVTHRDIKPHNILVAESGDDAGQVKVLDMGLARFEPLLDSPTESTTRASMTASGVIMGTVDYMSPEQALNSRNADARSDIYSLGCTMYFLLTGTTMFAGDTLMEKIIAHREQPLPKLREQVPEVPAGLDAVFQKMVARNPDDRYQTMNQLGEDLDACIAGRRSPTFGTRRALVRSGRPSQSKADSRLDSCCGSSIVGACSSRSGDRANSSSGSGLRDHNCNRQRRDHRRRSRRFGHFSHGCVFFGRQTRFESETRRPLSECRRTAQRFAKEGTRRSRRQELRPE